jgi:uncharacterized RDD family membrane protein YckC
VPAATSLWRALPALHFILCFLGAAHLAGAEIKAPDVLAHGDDEHFWVGQVTPLATVPKSVQTTVYDRVVGQDDKWETLARTPARVVELASRGSQPAALLDDGTWMLLYTDSAPFTAGPLPAPARMIALAGGRDAWWAVGAVPGGMAVIAQPTTGPATRPAPSAAAATQPASTRPAVTRLVLFSLTANDWKPVAELPDPPAAVPAASVALINESPYVALLDSAGTLRVAHLSGGMWVRDAGLDNLADVAQFKMLPHSTLPRLWVERQIGPDLLYAFGPKSSPPIQLTPISGSTPTSRTVAFFSGAIRIVADVQGKLIEQDFAADSGKPQRPATPLKLPQIGPMSRLQSLQLIVMTVALVIAVLGSFRQRMTMRGPALKLDEVPLAPYGRRLAAGLIDACPLILAVGGTLAHFHAAGPDLDPTAEVIILIVYWASGFFYVLYTTVMEALIGRSIGKVVLGLRIVSLDGSPPQPAALVTRNLLRLIDVGVFFLSLAMILLVPLRQRAGDVAAGTIVIFGEVQKKGDEEPAETTQSVEAKE